MGSLANNAIITKTKSMYGKYLKAEDYDRMIKLSTVPELVAYLKKHPNYKDILKDVSENTIHRGHLEALIRRNSIEKILKLVKLVYSDDKDFYMLDVIKQENEVILSVIRMMINDDHEDISGRLPFFYDVKTHIDYKKMLKIKDYDDLLGAVKGTDYEDILRPYYTKNKDQLRYLDIEHALEVYYYDLIFKTIKKNYSGKLKKDLEHLFQSKIDLSNVTKIYRLKKFYKADPITIKNVLVNEYSKMSDKKLSDLIAVDNPDQLLSVITKNHYFPIADEDDYVYIEYYTGKIRYQLAKKYMYFATEVPKVYAAFIILSEIEVENLTNIIEGIRYRIDDHEMKQMLIY